MGGSKKRRATRWCGPHARPVKSLVIQKKICTRIDVTIDQRTHTSDSSKPTHKFESHWGMDTICDGTSAGIRTDTHLRSVENTAQPKPQFALPQPYVRKGAIFFTNWTSKPLTHRNGVKLCQPTILRMSSICPAPGVATANPSIP